MSFGLGERVRVPSIREPTDRGKRSRYPTREGGRRKIGGFFDEQIWQIFSWRRKRCSLSTVIFLRGKEGRLCACCTPLDRIFVTPAHALNLSRSQSAPPSNKKRNAEAHLYSSFLCVFNAPALFKTGKTPFISSKIRGDEAESTFLARFMNDVDDDRAAFMNYEKAAAS